MFLKIGTLFYIQLFSVCHIPDIANMNNKCIMDGYMDS